MSQNESDATVVVISYYQRSRLDYFSSYGALYGAYNAWHRLTIDASSDRDALRELKSDAYLWEGYYEGSCLSGLQTYFEQVVKFTESGWPTRVKGAKDWRGLIDFWYKIRCELVHGQLNSDDRRHQRGVYLAYKTLDVYMAEVVSRIEAGFSDKHAERLEELHWLANTKGLSDKQRREKSEIYERFLNA